MITNTERMLSTEIKNENFFTQSMICIYCGEVLNYNSKETGFCANCGMSLRKNNNFNYVDIEIFERVDNINIMKEPEPVKEICPECKKGVMLWTSGCHSCQECGFSDKCSA